MNIIGAIEARDGDPAEKLVREHTFGLADDVRKHGDFLKWRAFASQACVSDAAGGALTHRAPGPTLHFSSPSYAMAKSLLTPPALASPWRRDHARPAASPAEPCVGLASVARSCATTTRNGIRGGSDEVHAFRFAD